MEFPSNVQSFLVIPTGATTGQRITINYNNDGEIKVYDSAGNLVDIIGGIHGAIHQIDSVSGAELLIQDGTIQFAAPSGLGSTIESFPPNGGILAFDSGYDGLGLDIESVSLWLYQGNSGGPINDTSTQPRAVIWNNNVAGGGQQVPAYVWVSGAIVSCSVDGTTAETWHNPTGQNSWNPTGTPPLRYRMMAENDVWWYGRIDFAGTAVTNAGAQFVTLAVPAAYRPPANSAPFPIGHQTSAGVVKNVNALGTFNADGTLSIAWGDGQSGTTHDAQGLAAGDRFFFNVRIPLLDIN